METNKSCPKPTETDGVRAGVPDLVQRIRDRKATLARIEAEAVRPQIEMGCDLSELKKRAGQAWVSQIRSLGYSTRAAGHLRRLGARWRHGDIGTAGSEFASRLPSDPRKLTWLCRLGPEQLRALTADLDCQAATLKEVVAAVKVILGEPVKVRPRPTALERLQTAIDRLLAAAEDLGADHADFEDGPHPMTPLRATVVEATAKVQIALTAAEKYPESESEAAPAA